MTTLNEVLKITGDACTRLDNGCIQVFIHHSRPYYGLTDYAVSSAVSGPSLMMVPNHVHEWEPNPGGDSHGFYCDCGETCYG